MWTQQFFFNHFHFLFLAVLLGMLLTLLEKCTYLEAFWSIFSPNIGLYGPEKLCIVLHSIIYSQKNIFNFWFVLAKRNKPSIRIRQNKIENTWCDETFACLQISTIDLFKYSLMFDWSSFALSNTFNNIIFLFLLLIFCEFCSAFSFFTILTIFLFKVQLLFST